MGIVEAISMTDGEIQPEFLCNFLNHVRGRKKWWEVASAFTKNFPSLASQLLEVRNTYYKYVTKRGPNEDRDIGFINRLHQRMMDKIASQASSDDKECPIAAKTESDAVTEENITSINFRKEFDVTETSVKIEPGMTEVAVKAELNAMEHVKSEADVPEILIKNETETFMRQSSIRGDSSSTNVSSYNPYGASYFTNITQMPFFLTSIKTEPIDVE